MATSFSSTLVPDNSTDANFRAWAGFIQDAFSGRWPATTDTGQTLAADLAHPTVANSKKGYRIYTMNDDLQATSPVFMRLDFGSGTSSANVPGIWITVGTGSDGAGNITGIIWNGGGVAGASVGSSSNSSSQVCNSYSSVANNRFAFALFIQATNAAYPVIFTMERTRDTTGAVTGDGLLLIYKTPAVSSLNTSRYIRMSGTQPTAETGLSYALTGKNPSETFGGDIGTGVIIHFYGVAQQPGVNILTVNFNDISAEGFITITLYGATRTYQQLNNCPPSKALVGSTTVDNTARLLMRYD